MGNKNEEYSPPKSKAQLRAIISGEEPRKTDYFSENEHYDEIIEPTYDEAYERNLVNRQRHGNHNKFSRPLKKKMPIHFLKENIVFIVVFIIR